MRPLARKLAERRADRRAAGAHIAGPKISNRHRPSHESKRWPGNRFNRFGNLAADKVNIFLYYKIIGKRRCEMRKCRYTQRTAYMHRLSFFSCGFIRSIIIIIETKVLETLQVNARLLPFSHYMLRVFNLKWSLIR